MNKTSLAKLWQRLPLAAAHAHVGQLVMIALIIGSATTLVAVGHVVAGAQQSPAPVGNVAGNVAGSVVGGGGGTSRGRVYSVSGTVGQAAVSTLQGSRFRVAGGFWYGAPSESGSPTNLPPARAQEPHMIFMPSVTRE